MNKNKIKYMMVTIFSIVIFVFQSCATQMQNTEVPIAKKTDKVNTIQIVNFNLEGIAHNDFMGVANEVAPNFAPLSGLIKKVWLSDKANNTYGGVYSWENNQSCKTYRNGELYAGALANNPNFVNLSDKGFDVLTGPTGVTGNLSNKTPTYIQIINFNLKDITHNDFMGIGNEVAPNFATLPGLTSKVWLSDEANNTYGGVYYWENKEACEAYRDGELYAGALANNPNFVNLSDKGFRVLDEPSKITHMK
tara:strand:- start:64 stop:813 length:750 start_codon:yes stop_codon:yes gene_type:complete